MFESSKSSLKETKLISNKYRKNYKLINQCKGTTKLRFSFESNKLLQCKHANTVKYGSCSLRNLFKFILHWPTLTGESHFIMQRMSDQIVKNILKLGLYSLMLNNNLPWWLQNDINNFTTFSPWYIKIHSKWRFSD